MNSSALSSRAIKRVLRDLAEIQQDPIPGLALCMPDINDPFTLHGNIEIKDGIYEGILIHLLIHIPEEYPIKPPAVNIAPGLDFGNEYHHHIYDNPTYGNSICTDLTSNFAGHFSVIDANGKPAKSGWTPAYTLSSVLMQLQVFFADPDMPQHILPSAEKIKSLRDHISQYTLDIRTNNDEDGVKIITHSSTTPYPPLSNTRSIVDDNTSEISDNEKETLEENVSALVKKEKSDLSVSTLSATHNSPITVSPSTEKKQESLEEEKEEVFNKEEEKDCAEESKETVSNGIKTTGSAWERPLKKVTKTTKSKSSATKPATEIVKVVKQAPITEQSFRSYTQPWFQNNRRFRGFDRVAQRGQRFNPLPRVQNNYIQRQTRDYQFQNVQLFSQQTQEKYAKVAQEVENIKIDTDSIFSQENIYKSTLTESQVTNSQIKKEISNKLICSVSKTNVFDRSKPVLGYPIDLEKAVYDRLWPTPIMELLSYDSFIFNIQQNFEKLDNYHRVKFTSSFGSQYNYWLPVYIDEAHFERSQQHIFNAIAIIYAGVEGKRENDFHPLMVLKVLPPILVKTAIHFLKGTIHQSIVGIDCYCQLYRLFVKLVELFPELQEAIDKEVEVFCKKEENRHKRVAGDLGEFIIKLSLSSCGLSDPEIIHLVLREHLTRQVSWALKKDKGLMFMEKCPNFLERFMAATQVSNQFFLTKLETARLLLDADVKIDLEKRRGVLNDATMKLFRTRLSWIQKNIVSNWSLFIEGVGQKNKISNDQVMISYVMKAFEASKQKGYQD